MASLGAGYDLSATTFSPDGRIFQVEYAAKAVEAAGTVVGLRARDGVVLVVERVVPTRLLRTDAGCSANRRIVSVDDAAGVAGAGLAADVRALANRAREEAAASRESLERPMLGAVLADRMALFMQAYTLYSSVRPFCASLLLAAVDEGPAGPVPGLWMVEPSGVCYAYRACAAGRGRQAARTELEKLDPAALSVRDALAHAVRVVYAARDEARDRDVVYEASWIGPESGFRHAAVPEDVVSAALEAARAAGRMDVS